MKRMLLIFLFGLCGCSSKTIHSAESNTSEENTERNPASNTIAYSCTVQKIKGVSFPYQFYKLFIHDSGNSYVGMSNDSRNGLNFTGSAVALKNYAEFHASNENFHMVVLKVPNQNGLGKVQFNDEIIPLDCQEQQTKADRGNKVPEAEKDYLLADFEGKRPNSRYLTKSSPVLQCNLYSKCYSYK